MGNAEDRHGGDQVGLPLSGYAPDPTPVVAASKIDSSTYDAEGQLTGATSWSSPGSDVFVQESLGYDGAGRLRKRLLGSGPDSMIYDPAGNLTSARYRSGQWITQTFDAANRMTQRTVPERIYGQSRCGLLPAGPITGFPDYNCFVTFPYYPNYGSGLRFEADISTFLYDAAGNMYQANNRYARIRRSFYNNGALKTDTTAIGGYWNPSYDDQVKGQSYSYDLNGRRTAMNWNFATTSYGYNPEGALDVVTDPSGNQYRFFYLLNGALDSLQLGSGVWEKRWYDDDGRMYRRRRKGGTKFELLLDELTFDRMNRAVTASATAQGMATETSRLHYDGTGAVLARETSRASGGAYVEEFRNDALGNVTWQRRRSTAGGNDAPFSTIYTPNGELSWRYSMLDNPPGQNQREDNLDQHFLSGGALHVQSHLIRVPNSTVEQQVAARHYYGADDKLMVVQRYSYRSSSTSDGTWEEYWYDALGRRVLTRTRRDLSSPPANSVYLCQGMVVCRSFYERVWWDGDQALIETRTPEGTSDVSNSGTVLNVHALGLDEPLAVITDVARIVTYNWRGLAVNDVLPNGTGTPTDTDWPGRSQAGVYFTPSPLDGGGTPSSPKKWLGTFVGNGQGTTTMLYRRNRYYSPTSGQFTQQDPIGIAGGMNLTGFAGGDPVNHSDPFGLCVPPSTAVCAGWVIAGVATMVTAAWQASRLSSDQARTGWDGQLIPTVGGRRKGEDVAVQEEGDLHGCMTCGTSTPGTPTGEWIRNHVPPTSVKMPGEEQKLGPHCQNCSSTQGGWLRQQLRKLKEKVSGEEKPKQVPAERGTKA